MNAEPREHRVDHPDRARLREAAALLVDLVVPLGDAFLARVGFPVALGHADLAGAVLVVAGDDEHAINARAPDAAVHVADLAVLELIGNPDVIDRGLVDRLDPA